MPIRKLSNGKYRVDISLGIDPITGKRRRKTKLTNSFKEAEEIYYSTRRDYHNGDLPSTFKRAYSFTELTEKFLAAKKREVKLSTFKTIENIVNSKILPYFKDSTIKSITHNDIYKYRETLQKDNLKHTYINKIMAYVKGIFDLAIEENLLSEHPSKKLKKLKNNHGIEEHIKFWTPEQFQKFIKIFDDNKYKDFFKKIYYTFAYFTGVRMGEQLALEWKDFNKYTNEIIINKTLTNLKQGNDFLVTSPKTSTSNRVITVNKKLSSLLKEWKDRQKEALEEYGIEQTDTTRIFNFNHRTPNRNYLNEFIKKACEKYNLDIPPINIHALRHSHVSLLINSGEDIYIISQRLGHKRTNTTYDIYGHLFPNRQKELADRLDNLF
ncbi:site-specific integrase [Bacillus spizizenii]|nr:site-specific integrase [Bacillus spizizenii]MCY8109586.1 site-specific integrase [Bacillus spizizenii]MCY8227981.1 site-specific integrase [Bacillus spizizenii]MCY8304126.1 site-specific integrase [Bacillus spizizenii]MCY8621352.1 site-specific integrase [Bacillus spizizenii]